MSLYFYFSKKSRGSGILDFKKRSQEQAVRFYDPPIFEWI